MRPTHNTSDKDLLRQLAAGDESALETMFREHAEGLRRIAYRFLRSSGDARAVVQDVFTAIWHRRAALTVRGPIAAYLATAVRNRSLTLIRDDLRRRERDGQWQRQQAERATAETIGDTNPARAQAVAKVEAALAELPPRQRTVFELRVRRDMTIAEIRDAIGVSTDKTVERLLAHAVQALREKLV